MNDKNLHLFHFDLLNIIFLPTRMEKKKTPTIQLQIMKMISAIF